MMYRKKNNHTVFPTMRIWIPVIIVYLAVVLACAHSPGGRAAPAKASGGSLFDGLMQVYDGPLNHLRSVRRGACPMYPSCSQYARQAVARYGFVRGWMMAMDRLTRCGRDEIKRAPKVLINGKWKYYDPVENNADWSNLKTSWRLQTSKATSNPLVEGISKKPALSSSMQLQ